MNSGWFTVEKADEDTYIISEYAHWEHTHMYLLRSGKEAVLIDTGTGIRDLSEVTSCLVGADITVLTTHVHWDHIGSHGSYARFGVHPLEREWIETKFPVPLTAVKKELLKEPFRYPAGFDPDSWNIFRGTPSFLQNDGDLITCGTRTLRVIHTPGHSPGHCVFYEPDRQYLYSGDLVYRGTIDAFYPSTDPSLLFSSVGKLIGTDIKKILPGHHDLTLPDRMIERMYEALSSLARQDLLRHGTGIFDFGDFSFHF